MLSERAKNWLAGPKALITAAALVGLIGWGGRGLLIGGVGGLVASLLIGVVINKVAGGMIPPQARKELAESVALMHPDIVEAAYPDTPKTEWVETLQDDAETIAERAVDLAPSHEMVWSQGNVLRAAGELAQEQETEEARALYECMGRQIARDWYGGRGGGDYPG